MANTYTQIYIHFVFAVQNRISLIHPSWEEELYQYMTGIISKRHHKLYVINGMPDHIHALVSMNPQYGASDLMHDVKRASSLWINEKHFGKGKFSWQEGFGAFSYGHSQISDVARYIEMQKKHHEKRSFIEEYIAFLKLFHVEYDERYIYKPIDY